MAEKAMQASGDGAVTMEYSEVQGEKNPIYLATQFSADQRKDHQGIQGDRKEAGIFTEGSISDYGSWRSLAAAFYTGNEFAHKKGLDQGMYT